MDQGVIQSLKAKYRTKVIRKYINVIDSDRKLTNITILGAMIMLEQSWSALFQNDDLAKQLRKHTAQLSDIIVSSSLEEQSTNNTFFKPIFVYCVFQKKGAKHIFSVLKLIHPFYLNTSIFQTLDFSNYLLSHVGVRKVGIVLYYHAMMERFCKNS